MAVRARSIPAAAERRGGAPRGPAQSVPASDLKNCDMAPPDRPLHARQPCPTVCMTHWVGVGLRAHRGTRVLRVILYACVLSNDSDPGHLCNNYLKCMQEAQ